MKKNKEILFSFYQGPISNKFPCKEITLKEVYELITSGELEQLTLKVHGNNKLKTVLLPYISVSGTFTCRRADSLLAYSGIICADIDHLEKYGLDVEDFKRTLANDKVLNLSLINTSPSGTGVKSYVSIEYAKAEEHPLYWEALYNYFLKTYAIKIDTACKDVSRATFLNQDLNAIFTEGCIKRVDLLALLPTPDAAACTDAIYRVSTPAPDYVSTATSVPAFTKPTTTDGPKPSEILNKDSRIHERAVAALKADGWQQNDNTDLWTRPGKDPKEGCSAKYNQWDQAGNIWIFTCFSTNAPHFGIKGYCDTQIICQLEFYGNWQKCISDLSAQYLD